MAKAWRPAKRSAVSLPLWTTDRCASCGECVAKAVPTPGPEHGTLTANTKRIDLRTPMVTANGMRSTCQARGESLAKIDPEHTLVWEAPAKRRGHMCSGVYLTFAFWVIYYNELDRKHNPVV